MHYGRVQRAREHRVIFLRTIIATVSGEIIVGFGTCDGCVLLLGVAV